jgi:uncharacterized Zn finger protein (UPF0148 family)
MTKYNIEGGINFYEELYKSLDDEENNQEGNLCLITNSPLSNCHISLDCGHKFNYEPLYNDILNHKTKFNNMERCILKTNEVRCPYCRKVQKTLLPYYEELGLQKIHGVNHIDETKQIKESYYSSIKWVPGVCCFDIFDPLQNISIPCNNTHVTLVEPTGKTYCYHHKYIAQKQFIAKKRLELREKLKLEKMNAKMEAKKEKEIAKENIKNQKMQEKMQEKIKNKVNKTLNKSLSTMGENVIVSSMNDVIHCGQILKTGVNKGQQCICKIFKDNLCTRHYNLANKDNKETKDNVTI